MEQGKSSSIPGPGKQGSALQVSGRVIWRSWREKCQPAFLCCRKGLNSRTVTSATTRTFKHRMPPSQTPNSPSLSCVFFLLKLTKVTTLVSPNSEVGGNCEKGFPEGSRSSGAPCKSVAEASQGGGKGVAAEVLGLHPTPLCYARHGFHGKETFHGLPQARKNQGPGSPVQSTSAASAKDQKAEKVWERTMTASVSTLTWNSLPRFQLLYCPCLVRCAQWPCWVEKASSFL